MNILLDQNISFRVVPLILGIFSNVAHVKDLGLTDSTDIEIWDFALKNGYTIVTFDSDFIDIANLKGIPPKVIWLKFGNSSNLKIAHKLIYNAEIITDFILSDSSGDISFLEII